MHIGLYCCTRLPLRQLGFLVLVQLFNDVHDICSNYSLCEGLPVPHSMLCDVSFIHSFVHLVRKAATVCNFK